MLILSRSRVVARGFGPLLGSWLLLGCGGSFALGTDTRTEAAASDDEPRADATDGAPAEPGTAVSAQPSQEEQELAIYLATLEQRLDEATSRHHIAVGMISGYLDGGSYTRDHLTGLWQLDRQPEATRARFDQRLGAVVTRFAAWVAAEAAGQAAPVAGSTDKAASAAVAAQATSDFEATQVPFEVVKVTLLDKAWSLSRTELGQVNGRFKNAHILVRAERDPTVCFAVWGRAYQVGDGSRWEPTTRARIDATARPARCAAGNAR